MAFVVSWKLKLSQNSKYLSLFSTECSDYHFKKRSKIPRHPPFSKTPPPPFPPPYLIMLCTTLRVSQDSKYACNLWLRWLAFFRYNLRFLLFVLHCNFHCFLLSGDFLSFSSQPTDRPNYSCNVSERILLSQKLQLFLQITL